MKSGVAVTQAEIRNPHSSFFILTVPLAGIVEGATSATGTMVGAMAGTSVTAALTPFLLVEIAISHYEEGSDYY